MLADSVVMHQSPYAEGVPNWMRSRRGCFIGHRFGILGTSSTDRAIDFMSGQSLIDHLIGVGQLYTSVYEEVQYEAQVNHLRHSRLVALRDDKDASEVRKETSEAKSS
jgi:hypothetical protein